MVNYLLESYATDAVMAKGDAGSMRLIQQLNMAPIAYAEFFWAKAVRWDRMEDVDVLKVTSSKAYYISYARACVRTCVRSHMQLYRIWCDMQDP